MACGAFSGMVGGLVDQGAKCVDGQKGGCSAGSFIKSGLIGGVTGAVGGALGPLGGKVLGRLAPKALDAVGGLFGKGAGEAADAGVSDAGDAAAGAESRSATQSAESSTDNAGQASQSGDDGAAGEGGSGEGCSAGPHSFTGGTRVLMADGSSKPIDRVEVGDRVADSVPGASATQDHTVTAVIVTRTDHDFVDVGVAPSVAGGAPKVAKPVPVGATAGAGVVKAGGVRRAALGLAAALTAIAGVLGGVHGGDSPERTSAVASVLPASSGAPGSGSAGPAGLAQPGGTLTTTFHHPFYDITRSAFVDAQHLRTGDELQTPTGHARVTSVRLYHANTVTYDLTIGALHTYYVEAGDTPVLVHNCTGGVDAAGNACSCSSPRPATWTIDAIDHPDSAIHAAERGGDGMMATIDRPGIDARRADNLRGVRTAPGMDRDEFPPAMFKEGAGAHVKLIAAGDNRGAGSSMGAQLADIPDGGRVLIQIENLDAVL